VPEFHTLEGFSFNTFNGISDKRGSILLGSDSILRIRLPLEHANLTKVLNNSVLVINRNSIILGKATHQRLTPNTRLQARIVIIKGPSDSREFITSCQRQLQKMEVNAMIQLLERTSMRMTKERPYDIWGYRVALKNLTPEASIKIQELGIGGKRRLGCGVFGT
jgi:CRISPR-associated protein Cas6